MGVRLGHRERGQGWYRRGWGWMVGQVRVWLWEWVWIQTFEPRVSLGSGQSSVLLVGEAFDLADLSD